MIAYMTAFTIATVIAVYVLIAKISNLQDNLILLDQEQQERLSRLTHAVQYLIDNTETQKNSFKPNDRIYIAEDGSIRVIETEKEYFHQDNVTFLTYKLKNNRDTRNPKHD